MTVTMTPLVQDHLPILVHLCGAPELVVPEVGAGGERLAQEGEGEHTDWSVVRLVVWSTHSFTQGAEICSN